MPRARFSRSQNSFQLTASGPPSSNSRFAASGLRTDSAKKAATSPIQMGWIRCVPAPGIGVTGVRRASRANVGRMPPSRPKMKLGRNVTHSRSASRTACSISHFAP